MNDREFNKNSGSKPNKRVFNNLALIITVCIILTAVTIWLVVSFDSSAASRTIPSPTKVNEPADPAEDELNKFYINEQGQYVIPKKAIKNLNYQDPDIFNTAIRQSLKEKETATFPLGMSDVNKREFIVKTLNIGDKIYAFHLGWENSSFEKNRFTNMNISQKALFTLCDEYEYCESLFLLDLQTKDITKVSKDQTGNFDIRTLNEIGLVNPGMDECKIKWVENPLPSQDDTMAAFSSNRRDYPAFIDDFRSGKISSVAENDIWIHNLATGEENLLIENAGAQFWTGDNLVYRNHADDTTWSINIITKEKKKILDNKVDVLVQFLRYKIDEALFFGKIEDNTNSGLNGCFLYDFNKNQFHYLDSRAESSSKTVSEDGLTSAFIYGIDADIENNDKQYLEVVNNDKKTIYIMPDEGLFGSVITFLTGNRLLISKDSTENSKIAMDYYIVDLEDTVDVRW